MKNKKLAALLRSAFDYRLSNMAANEVAKKSGVGEKGSDKVARKHMTRTQSSTTESCEVIAKGR